MGEILTLRQGDVHRGAGIKIRPARPQISWQLIGMARRTHEFHALHAAGSRNAPGRPREMVLAPKLEGPAWATEHAQDGRSIHK